MPRYIPAELHRRLQPFLEAGLLRRVPTPWQIWQGEIEMTPYVLSSDATAEETYDGAPLGHPLLRQPLLLSQIGLDHLRTGSALDVQLESLCAHLQLTHHRGMPVFDLQAVQTHPGGLARLRQAIEEIHTGSTARGRRRRRLARLILGRPDAYFERFLGADGWIARAERLDYPAASEEGNDLPREYYSLVGFLDYCAGAFPAAPRDLAWHRWPGHLVRLATRRLRAGRSMGWLRRPGGGR
jgi:hypothetical protein